MSADNEQNILKKQSFQIVDVKVSAYLFVPCEFLISFLPKLSNRLKASIKLQHSDLRLNRNERQNVIKVENDSKATSFNYGQLLVSNAKESRNILFNKDS